MKQERVNISALRDIITAGVSMKELFKQITE